LEILPFDKSSLSKSSYVSRLGTCQSTFSLFFYVFEIESEQFYQFTEFVFRTLSANLSLRISQLPGGISNGGRFQTGHEFCINYYSNVRCAQLPMPTIKEFIKCQFRSLINHVVEIPVPQGRSLSCSTPYGVLIAKNPS